MTDLVGAGRNPDAGVCPGGGRIEGKGPIRGLNGGFGAGGGAFGLVEVTNCGFVRFKQVLNSTVEPRYREQLSVRRSDATRMRMDGSYRSPSVTPDMNGTSQTISIDFAFSPMTTPLMDNGTPPES
jgi:hypothetical protein